MVLSDNATAVDVCHATGPQRLEEGVLPLDLPLSNVSFAITLPSAGEESTTNESPSSVNTFAEWFFAEFARVTDQLINEEDRRAVHDVRQLQIPSDESELILR